MSQTTGVPMTKERRKLLANYVIDHYDHRGLSFTDLSEKLNSLGFKTVTGLDWTRHTVRTFYRYEKKVRAGKKKKRSSKIRVKTEHQKQKGKSKIPVKSYKNEKTKKLSSQKAKGGENKTKVLAKGFGDIISSNKDRISLIENEMDLVKQTASTIGDAVRDIVSSLESVEERVSDLLKLLAR